MAEPTESTTGTVRGISIVQKKIRLYEESDTRKAGASTVSATGMSVESEL